MCIQENIVEMAKCDFQDYVMEDLLTSALPFSPGSLVWGSQSLYHEDIEIVRHVHEEFGGNLSYGNQ